MFRVDGLRSFCVLLDRSLSIQLIIVKKKMVNGNLITHVALRNSFIRVRDPDRIGIWSLKTFFASCVSYILDTDEYRTIKHGIGVEDT